jgi:hypothetical protein
MSVPSMYKLGGGLIESVILSVHQYHYIIIAFGQFFKREVVDDE